MMPAERNDWCGSCGTAPCTHPAQKLERPTRADLAWIVAITIIGWIGIIIGATLIGSGL